MLPRHFDAVCAADLSFIMHSPQEECASQADEILDYRGDGLDCWVRLILARLSGLFRH